MAAAPPSGQVRIGGISQRIGFLQLAGQRRWQAVFGEATAISMCGLLAGCCRGGRPLLTVCKQLVWAVAERLETFLDSRLRNAPPPPPPARSGDSASRVDNRQRICIAPPVGALLELLPDCGGREAAAHQRLDRQIQGPCLGLAKHDGVLAQQRCLLGAATGNCGARRRVVGGFCAEKGGPRTGSQRQKWIFTSIVLRGF